MSNNQMAAAMVARGINVKWLRSIENEPKPVKGAGMPPGMVTVKHQGGPPPLGGGRNWVHSPVYFRGALHTYLSYQINLLHVLGHLRHPRGKPFDADPVRLCQTLARKGTAETRFEAVFGRSEANVPARRGPLRFVGACRLAWRSG